LRLHFLPKNALSHPQLAPPFLLYYNPLIFPLSLGPFPHVLWSPVLPFIFLLPQAVSRFFFFSFPPPPPPPLSLEHDKVYFAVSCPPRTCFLCIFSPIPQLLYMDKHSFFPFRCFISTGEPCFFPFCFRSSFFPFFFPLIPPLREKLSVFFSGPVFPG